MDGKSKVHFLTKASKEMEPKRFYSENFSL